MKNIICTISLALLTGCASFSTQQTDESIDPKTSQTRKITTKVHAFTFFEGKSTLANSKASQTDKTQSASLGSLSQESNTATNAAAIAGEFMGSMAKQLIKQ